MRIITRKKQAEIAKQLAAIYYTAVHWRDEEWADFVKCIVGNCADIAFTVGGERMMAIEDPALVIEVNRLNKQIEALSKKENTTRWIPVTERLPDNIDEEVLVCNEGYGKDGTGFATIAVYNGNGWLECWERKQYLDCITHWMPLPEPQKEE